jgi:carnitine-CoA ligase
VDVTLSPRRTTGVQASDFDTELSPLGGLYSETISSILAARADERGGTVALQFMGRTLTYRELLDAATAFAHAVEAIPGGQPGDRVCVLLENGLQFVIAFFGTVLAGRIFVPLNVAYQAPQLEFVLGDVEPAVFVTETNYLPLVSDVVSRSAAAPFLVLVDNGPDSPRSAGSIDFGAFLNTGAHGPATFRPRPSTPMMILYTSGTTGQSKGIIYRHRATIWFAGIACYALELSDADILHTCLPLFHANALLCTVVAGTIVGATTVISPRFSVSGFWREVAESNATVTSMLGSMPTLLWRAEPHPDETAHRLRLAYVAPLPDGIVAEFQERFRLALATTYGLTDASILTVGRAGPDLLSGSCGRQFPDWELKLVDDDDEPVPPGAIGEMIARSRLPHIGGSGYWRNGEATAEAWSNLWHHSGDLLAQDETGAYHYRERKKDSIRKAGENVSSFEVELAITAVPGVDQAAVFAVPSDLGDDEIMAVIVPREGTILDLASLREQCRAVLPYFAVPRFWETADTLPLTETSRVRKSELRGRGVTASTWDSGPVRRGAVTRGTSR